MLQGGQTQACEPFLLLLEPCHGMWCSGSRDVALAVDGRSIGDDGRLVSNARLTRGLTSDAEALHGHAAATRCRALHVAGHDAAAARGDGTAIASPLQAECEAAHHDDLEGCERQREGLFSELCS